MKKKINFYISHNLADVANGIIREKSDLINLILETIPEIILEGKGENVNHNLGYCEILIGKMSRIVFTLKSEKGRVYKKFSFTFPFQIVKQTDPTAFTTWSVKDNTGIEISSQLVSVLRSLYSDKWFDENLIASAEALKFYDEMYLAMQDVDLEYNLDETSVWHVIRRLFLFEPGYLRYDYDNDEDRLDAIYHPLHHLDIFFSNKATFKIGLIDEYAEKAAWNLSGFENLIDIDAPCYYIK